MTVKTPHLQGRGDICLFVPKLKAATRNLPIYLLLHGVYGSAWAWALKGGAHHTAARLIKEQKIRPAIIAMPSDGLWGDGSAYFAHHGKQFDQWIVSDVPLAIRTHIPEAGPDSPLCIGGLSMGGYGALSLGARFPDHFQAISAHSSITRLAEMADFVEEPLEAYQAENPWPDVFPLLQAHRAHLPPLRFDCGLQDPLLESNRTLHQQLTEADIAHTYAEYPGGHEWAYWQEQVAKSLRFFDAAISKP